MKTQFYNTELIDSQIHHYGKDGKLDCFSISFVLVDGQYEEQFSRSALQTDPVKNRREARKAILAEVQDICKRLKFERVAQVTIL